MKLSRSELLAVSCLAAAVVLLYGHTLNVPFYLDDTRALAENYRLRDLPATVAKLFSQRGFTNLTFALNFRLTGWALPPLHLTNIALHAACGLLVWRLLGRLFSGRTLPLLGALLFLVHPLQTQAVTYLVQRSAVLAALFSLVALLLYLTFRERRAAGVEFSSAACLAPYLGAVLSGAFAVLSKESAATLPLILFVYDRLFPQGSERGGARRLAVYLPFCLVPLALGAATLIGLWLQGGEKLLYYPLASLQHNASLNYLFTQFSVLWIYLRLLLLPYGQALEHDYPVVGALLTAQNALALAGWLAVLWAAWRFRRQRPLAVFGLTWFLLALVVESSVIPLDPLFEHRLYLAMPGALLAILDLLTVAFGMRRAGVLCLIAVLACLPLTWQRNALWNDPTVFFEDNLRVIPDSERAMISLSALYLRESRFAEARALLERAVLAYPGNDRFYINLALLASKEGRPEEAFTRIETGLRRLPAVTELYETAAALAQHWGNPMRAEHYLRQGLAHPETDKARLDNNLGVLFGEEGRSDEALHAFASSLERRAVNPVALRNLGKEYFVRQNWSEAYAALRRALEYEPGHPEALEGLGRTALLLGDVPAARRALAKLEHSDPTAARRLRNAVDPQPRHGAQ